ncbi:hypothetical protein BGZ67_000283 [Mortierella alpina]|nr:hypothetical protein BGZ67_000283 [Mortierella alpina]
MIPVSQEYDPGKNVDSTRAHAPATVAPPHGYLYSLDLSRIHRLLRPIKAKIAAIRLAIKTAPSFGYASTVATSSSIADNTSDSGEQSGDNGCALPHPQTARLRNGNARSIRARDVQDRHSRSTTTSQRLRDGNDMTMATNNSGEQSGADILLKRFQSSLVDQFKDVVEKVWWQPFCDDYGLPINTTPASATAMGLQPTTATLGVTCAFMVGRIVACLPEDDVATMETYYSIMPVYMRRFAVLEHLSELCLTQIPIQQLIEPLVGICVRYKADAQTLRLLQHLLTSQDNSYQLDYDWAYHHALQIGCGDAWVETLRRSSPSAFFTAGSFQSFLRHVSPNHRAVLIRTSFDIHMDEFVHSISERTRRSRTSHWTSMLIEDSFRSHEQHSENSVVPDQKSCVNGCDDVIDYMARQLFMPSELYTDGDVLRWYHMGLKEVALGLALHSLYIAVTESPESSKESTRVDEWTRILKRSASSDIRLSDFDVIVKSYSTLTQLNALALMLDAVGLYSISMRLINRMLRDFYALEKSTRKRLGHACHITKASLQAHLREVEQRRIEYADKDGWRYDEFLGDWVKQTPIVKKSGLVLNEGFLTSDIDEDDDFDLRTPTKSRDHGRYNISFNLDPRKYSGRGSSKDGLDDHTENEDQDNGPRPAADVIVLSDTTDYGEMSNDTRSDHPSEEDDDEEEEEEEEEEERHYSGMQQHGMASESEFGGISSEEDDLDPQPVRALRSKRRRTPSPFSPSPQKTRVTRSPFAKKRAQSYLVENVMPMSSGDDSMVSEYEDSRAITRSQLRSRTRSTRSSNAGSLKSGSVSKSAPLSRRSQRLHCVASKRDDTDDASDVSVDEHDDPQEQVSSGFEETMENEDVIESDASDRFAKEKHQTLDEQYSNYHSYSEDGFNDGEEDARHGESDEDVTITVYKEQLDSLVGPPLPLTEPDELAFWI